MTFLEHILLHEFMNSLIFFPLQTWICFKRSEFPVKQKFQFCHSLVCVFPLDWETVVDYLNPNNPSCRREIKGKKKL